MTIRTLREYIVKCNTCGKESDEFSAFTNQDEDQLVTTLTVLCSECRKKLGKVRATSEDREESQ